MFWLVPSPASLNLTVSDPSVFIVPVALMKCGLHREGRGGGHDESREQHRQRDDEQYASSHAKSLPEDLGVWYLFPGMRVGLIWPPVRADMGIMKWRFVRSPNARAGGPRDRGRHPVLR